LTIAFGKWPKSEALQGADWKEMGAASHSMDEMVPELMGYLNKGERPPTDLAVRLQQENLKLAKFALAANGKLPTHATGNGEFTHPIVLANIMAEELRAAGHPLSESQIADIGTLGEQYDFDYDNLQSTYGDDTFALQKVADELELKHKFVEAVEALLAPDQRAFIVQPATHDVAQLDLHSPLLMVMGYAHPWGQTTKEALRGDVVKWVTDHYKVEPGREGALGPMADAWLEGVAPTLAPVARGVMPFFTYADAVAAARAVLRFRQAMVAQLGLDDASQKAVREDPSFGVPRLVKDEEQK
ncbi:MAG TPA: hypothetical protein VHF22_14590, partial [Planctomycetota bacterium]|nr:hypothetical protein [Planctomycetota bacterium]